MPRLFPFMKGQLSIYPLTSTETQLDFCGVYQAPLGAVGKTMNAIVRHRIAEVSVHHQSGAGQEIRTIISRQYPRDLSVPSIKAAVSRACSTTGNVTETSGSRHCREDSLSTSDRRSNQD